VRLLAGERLVASGSARARGARSRSLAVTLRLTSGGRALLARELGGVRTRVRARAATSGGPRGASARTRALLALERFTTLPGSFLPGEAALTARGERFLRSLRGRLVAVAALRCEGHSARLQAPAVATGPLSLARAALLCRTLRTLGLRVPASVVGRGNAHPSASNASEAGRAENRRVFVTVTHRPRGLS
jgi:outer membrane protein OmpA-like peptidoglycan-associated protein